MPIAEPTVEQFAHNPVGKYVAATRPPFLLAALVPCFIGLATAFYDGNSIYWFTALLTMVGAVVIHAGINVLNDYYDSLNGTDARNTDRLFPFTGGSRFIQNGVLTERQTAVYGAALMGVGMVIGTVLLPYGGWGLLGVGLVGLLIGWAYSAPPLALNSRGLGELCVAVGFGSLITVGADMVQSGEFDAFPLLVSAPYGLLVAALLYVNQFPDLRADAAAGKHHWVVRLGARRARWGYLALMVAAYGLLGAMVLAGVVPVWGLLGMLSLPFSVRATVIVARHAEMPARLVPAIQMTIAAMLVHGIALSAGLVLG